MTIENRQMMEKNRRAKIVGVAMLIFGFCLVALGFLANLGMTPLNIGRALLFPILLVVYVVYYRTHKDSKTFLNIGSFILFISYLDIALFTKSAYMYAYIYLLMIYIMLYVDKKFTFRWTFILSACSIVVMVRFMIMDPAAVDNALIQGVFAIFASIMMYNVVALNDKHSKENLEEITERAKQASDVGSSIIALSEELGEKFVVAKDNASEMGDNMTATEESVSEIADSIRVTAEAIEQQTRLTTEIQSSLENTERETRSMQEAAQESSVAVKAGREAMELLAKQASLTGELNRRSQETTSELGARIHDVEEITGEILNISSQTNLLALHASIEAARAGEAGKGFAVVADEIRQLSEQTKNSVNKITDIINRLVENSNEASDNMTKSIAATDEQNRMVGVAIGDIEEIAKKNEILVELMRSIAKEIEEILQANTQITESISNLSAMSEEVSASSEYSRDMMRKSVASVDELNILLGEIYKISEEMAAITQNQQYS